MVEVENSFDLIKLVQQAPVHRCEDGACIAAFPLRRCDCIDCSAPSSASPWSLRRTLQSESAARADSDERPNVGKMRQEIRA